MLALAFAITLFAQAAPTPVYPQNQATVHALEELANAIAQGRITRTPTPTVTPTATPTLTLIPTAVPVVPTVVSQPEPTATLAPCWFTDETYGDPDNGYIVFDDQGAPVPCPPEGNAAPEGLPDAEPVIDMPTPTATPSRVPVVTRPQVPQPQIIYVQVPAAEAPPTREIPPTMTAVPTFTAIPTATLRVLDTVTPVPTRTEIPTRTPPSLPTVTPAATPRPVRPVPQPAVANPPRPPEPRAPLPSPNGWDMALQSLRRLPPVEAAFA